ncbi:hypothetical protein SK128_014092 [Halocaridina rubra]|uniref:Uncharacterized protein n=1 Tax=Halocaridina rubra TaxID=373956 RepID=A0AAN8X8S1_HALRR
MVTDVIMATVVRANPRLQPMFIEDSPISAWITTSVLISMVVAFLFFVALPSELSLIRLGGIVIVLLTTATLLGFGIWGTVNLQQKFDPLWFLPPSSYLFQFFSKLEFYYPEDGERGSVYLGALNYPEELMKIGSLTEEMRSNPYISSVDSWYDLLVNTTLEEFDEDIRGQPLNESFFTDIMTNFLFNGIGLRYASYFHIADNFSLGEPLTLLVSLLVQCSTTDILYILKSFMFLFCRAVT